MSSIDKCSDSGGDLKIHLYSFEQLKHFLYLTMLLNSGIDLKVISDHLGHCDINVTADIYADVLSNTRKVIADSIEKKLTE